MEEIQDPRERVISTMIPALLLEKGEADPEWAQFRNGWVPIPSNTLAAYYEDSIDLSGYALQQMTFFPQLAFIQESPLRSITGSEAAGIIDVTVISTTPLDIDGLYRQVAFAGGPGLTQLSVTLGSSTPADWETIPYCRIRNDILNSTGVSSTGFTQPLDMGQIGSLEPTAADKLFIYRLIIPYGIVTSTVLFGTLTGPAQRVGFRGEMAQEPTLEYMMRLKRSYELANQV